MSTHIFSRYTIPCTGQLNDFPPRDVLHGAGEDKTGSNCFIDGLQELEGGPITSLGRFARLISVLSSLCEMVGGVAWGTSRDRFLEPAFVGGVLRTSAEDEICLSERAWSIFMAALCVGDIPILLTRLA